MKFTITETRTTPFWFEDKRPISTIYPLQVHHAGQKYAQNIGTFESFESAEEFAKDYASVYRETVFEL